MATVTLSEHEVEVGQLVGTKVLLQARQLVARGEVQAVRHDPQGEHVDLLAGEIGPLDRSVRAAVLLERRRGGDLINVEASCSCGSARPCPHSIAVVLTHLGVAPAPLPAGRAAGAAGRARAAAPQDRVRPAAKPVRPAWARTFDRLLEDPPEASAPSARSAAAQVAVQFELVRSGAGRGRPGPVGIVVRPARRSDSGNWVRSGISWHSVIREPYSYEIYRRTPRLGDHEQRLLEELAALREPPTYDRSDGWLDLAQSGSRRVWDLLAEIRGAGIPLVWAGRDGEVGLAGAPVRPHVDVVRAAGGAGVEEASGELLVQARLCAGPAQVPADRYQLLGRPAHGLLWWPADGDPRLGGRARGLTLAPLSEPVPAVVAGLLAQGPVTVPGADAEAFLADVYPRLRERLSVVSSDASVVLPAPEPPRLHLAVTADPDAGRAALAWSWAWRLGSRVRLEPLDGAGAPPPDEASSQGLAARLADRFRDLPELFERDTVPASGGATSPRLAPRLAPRAELDGVRTARLFAEVLPYLAADGEVDVEVRSFGAARDYHQLDDAPEIAFTQADGQRPGDPPDWFDLAVSVSVGGHEVPFQELFTALAQDQTHLLLPNGGYFSLDREEYRALARLIAESRTLLDAPAATVRLTRFQVGAWAEVEQLGTVTAADVAGWRDAVRVLLDAASGGSAVRPADPPPGLRATLRSYQKSGLDWLVALQEFGLGGVLADDMGLGKTLQVLALVLHARERDPGRPPVLVVAPTSVVANWAGEAARFAPDLRTVAITETAARRGAGLDDVTAGADLVVTSYALFRIEHADYVRRPWSGLVLDEAQAVKNHQSVGYRCARDLPAPFKLAVTGTPIENNLMELWSLMSITAPGLFATAARFAEHYRSGIERERDPELLAQLRRRLRPLMLRRTKDLVAADLPDKQEQVLELDLSPRHRAVYDKYLHRERQKVLGLLGDLNRNRFEIFRSLTLLRQAALDVALVDPVHAKVGSTKLDVLMDQLGNIAGEGHRVLVFSQFTRFLTAARDRLEAAGIEYCYLDGTTRNRPAVIDRFRTGNAPAFLISLKAGGTGLTLTEADYVVLLDPWWNPATEAQAVDRVHRIGQTRKVMVYRLVAKDTIEDKVMALKAGKSALISSVLDAGDLASGALDENDIRALLG